MDGGSGKNILKIRVKTEHITSFLHTTVCIWPRKQTYAVAPMHLLQLWQDGWEIQIIFGTESVNDRMDKLVNGG